MTSPIDWTYYRTFLAVADEGSLSGAARALGITQPTVGRHVAALEHALGLALFTRSHAGLMPTEAAIGLQVQAREMASSAAAMERLASGQGLGVRGVVRVTASEVIGVEVLPPIIAALREHYPDLKVELAVSNRIQNVLHREADIAVRMVRPQQEQLLARHVGGIEIGLHATAGYIARHGKPERYEDLPGYALIGFDQSNDFIRSASQSQPLFRREHFALRADSDLAQLALLRAGAGFGACQVRLAQRDAALVRVLPSEFSLMLDTWVAMHEDLRNSPRCRVTFDALAEGLKRYIAA
ncbi:LysR family transcriptional regulator [Paludibacterium yongneupense]|uniref:LysR family transcriptional regulator n=1 Tax=Paludibacterium yongneupense TaxID=400061 RepID=UPI00040609C4|nr:LysR family transcriptional regulator [Paludibacterium yongneupense]